MILVSSCLMGINSRYNSKSDTNELIMEYCKFKMFIPVCPEQLGGLATPRPASEIKGGTGKDVLFGTAKVVSDIGIDVTYEYIKGANEVLKFLKMYKVSCAILKQRSPSCGSGYIYDGTFDGKIIAGQGVTVALLNNYNVPVFSEEDVTAQFLEKIVKCDNLGSLK